MGRLRRRRHRRLRRVDRLGVHRADVHPRAVRDEHGGVAAVQLQQDADVARELVHEDLAAAAVAATARGSGA